MFRILSLLFLMFSYAGSAKPIIVPENRFLKEVQLTPQKLKLEGDSVRFTVKGLIPIESVLIPKNPKVSLSFKAEQNNVDLGIIDLKKNVSSYAYEKRVALKYEPWMSGAVLELSFFQGRKENNAPSEKKILARGVMTPQLMVKLGEVYPDEPIPVVGLFITSGILDREIVRKQEFSIQFDLGSSTYKSTSTNQKTLQELDAFLEANPTIQEMRITGIQSPENGEGNNSALGMNRAESVKEALGIRLNSLPESQLKVDSRRNDWFDLRLLLRDYKGISTSRKDELYAILMNQESFLEQNERLKKVPGFAQVSQDLFPKLRVAKIEISAKPRAGLDMQQSMLLKEALSKSDGTNSLSFEEWTLAAEASQSLEEKAVIYSKMTEFYRSALPYNNMAVVRMRQAQRTLDPQSKEILWEEAQRLLTQAYRIEPNPYTIHNQGQILALEGSFWDAYLKLSEASSLTKDPDFLMRNEALKGALDILRGDYKLATLRFDYQFSDPKDYFNKGLAYFMIQDYANATIAFEESVVQGRAFGYGFYGLAMIAAASGQREVAVIHLKKAIEANRQLSERAFQDPLFEELRESEDFFVWISSK
ncbi:TPR end-of-group domain-containing protein [Algoriphagus boritolerans]|uniref:OmpA family protein n=1 Tax=Algoriphagus boritolerans DSM 17298 = JCM 18970 TaxID=1120964 RepID=A0A1H5WFP8_9BACT|nr:OmpA family protein [Algoriphagus boritolerans]SEF98272.1 OmpA family protein [Algoriphagus boritolerans DSM 17298 = JCM 18970]